MSRRRLNVAFMRRGLFEHRDKRTASSAAGQRASSVVRADNLLGEPAASKNKVYKARSLQLDRALLDRVRRREVASAEVAGLDLAELRALLGALLASHGAAGVEAAAGRRVDR